MSASNFALTGEESYGNLQNVESIILKANNGMNISLWCSRFKSCVTSAEDVKYSRRTLTSKRNGVMEFVHDIRKSFSVADTLRISFQSVQSIDNITCWITAKCMHSD